MSARSFSLKVCGYTRTRGFTRTRPAGRRQWRFYIGAKGAKPPQTTKNEGFSPPKIPRVVHNFFARVVTLTYSLCFFLLLWLLFIGVCQCICLLLSRIHI